MVCVHACYLLLVTYAIGAARAESTSPVRVEHMYGLPGHPVELECRTCQGGEHEDFATLDWSRRCLGCGEKYSVLVHTVHEDHGHSYPLTNHKDRMTVSLSNCSLTISSFLESDAGQYRCKYTKAPTTIIYLKVYDQKPHPEIMGVQSAIVIGRQPEVSCHVDYFRTASASFVWSIEDNELPARTLAPEIYEDNSARFSSLLLHHFDRRDAFKDLICSVTINGVHGMAREIVQLDLHYTYHTEVQTRALSNHRLRGDTKELQCVVSSEGNPTSQHPPSWTKNGETIFRNARYAMTDNKLIIQNFSTSLDNGKYQCSIANAAGQTRLEDAEAWISLPSYTLYTSVNHASTGPPVLGESMQLLCNVTMGSNSNVDIQHYVWHRQEDPLHANQEKYEGVDSRLLTIKKLETIDNGLYTCRAVSMADIPSQQTPFTLRVWYPPSVSFGDGLDDHVFLLPKNGKDAITCGASGFPPMDNITIIHGTSIDDDEKVLSQKVVQGDANMPVGAESYDTAPAPSDADSLTVDITIERTGDFVCAACNALTCSRKKIHVELQEEAGPGASWLLMALIISAIAAGVLIGGVIRVLWRKHWIRQRGRDYSEKPEVVSVEPTVPSKVKGCTLRADHVAQEPAEQITAPRASSIPIEPFEHKTEPKDHEYEYIEDGPLNTAMDTIKAENEQQSLKPATMEGVCEKRARQPTPPMMREEQGPNSQQMDENRLREAVRLVRSRMASSSDRERLLTALGVGDTDKDVKGVSHAGSAASGNVGGVGSEGYELPTTTGSSSGYEHLNKLTMEPQTDMC